MSLQPNIVGAGLAGLIAAHAWPSATVLEAAPEPRGEHRALLRFRTDAVSRLTGIEFRQVRVRKGIWSEFGYRAPNMRLANAYAQKVLGRLTGERSIWALDPVDRFIAPETLYEELVAAVGRRVRWGTPADFEDRHGPLISTAPMPVVLGALNIAPPEFHRAPIHVVRARVPGADLFQTAYFPDEDTSLYRASITGDVLIAEFAATNPLAEPDVEHGMALAADAFSVRKLQVLERVNQQYGKIAPLADAARKALLFRLTHDHRIYSLGRFATWRNILLDDVVDDIAVIKRLLRTNSNYDLHRATTSERKA